MRALDQVNLSIITLQNDEIELVDGGFIPFVLYFAGGVIAGAGIYLATEYLT